MPQHPEPDLEAVVARLTNENSQVRETLRQVEHVLTMDPEFHGLSIVGGVKTLYRRYKEELAKNLVKK